MFCPSLPPADGILASEALNMSRNAFAFMSCFEDQNTTLKGKNVILKKLGTPTLFKSLTECWISMHVILSKCFEI